jgi:hypothetical protein
VGGMKLPFIASVIVFVELGGMILIHRDKVGKTNCDRSDFFLYHLFKVNPAKNGWGS